MTTNKAAEALLRWARALDDRLSKDFGIPKSAEFILDESLDRIIAEATAQQAAEVERLREALEAATSIGELMSNSGRPDRVVVHAPSPMRHWETSGCAICTALAPAVAPAPDSAPNPPGERSEDCAGNFVDGYCRRHEPSFHGYNGAVSVPEPAR